MYISHTDDTVYVTFASLASITLHADVRDAVCPSTRDGDFLDRNHHCVPTIASVDEGPRAYAFRPVVGRSESI